LITFILRRGIEIEDVVPARAHPETDLLRLMGQLQFDSVRRRGSWPDSKRGNPPRRICHAEKERRKEEKGDCRWDHCPFHGNMALQSGRENGSQYGLHGAAG